MSNFFNLLAAGITAGAIYGVFAACLAIWFRVCNVLNLAVGDFAMLGVVGVAELSQVDHVNFGLSVLLDLAGVGLLAWAFDRVVLHFALDRGRAEHGIVSVFFYTFGLSLAIEGVTLAVFGTDVRSAPAIWSGPALTVADFHVQRAGVLVIGLAVVVGIVLWTYLRYTVSGRAASACGESLIGSRIVGIDSAFYRRWIFVATALLAAVFGIVESPMNGFTYASGPALSLLGVVAAGFAAFRRPGRAVVVGLLLGIAEALIGGYVSTAYNDVILYAALFAVIVFQPRVLGLPATAA